LLNGIVTVHYWQSPESVKYIGRACELGKVQTDFGYAEVAIWIGEPLGMLQKVPGHPEKQVLWKVAAEERMNEAISWLGE